MSKSPDPTSPDPTSPHLHISTSPNATLSARQSRRNVFAAAAACFTGFTGFTIVMPFLPLYVSELGVSDLGEVAMWSGLTLGATPAVTAISAPFWGRVGDKYGSKILVLRSLAAFVLTKGAMAFVTAPWQLFALRALLGVFAGYGALTVSMAAESVPREQMAKAIGSVQMGQRLGPAIGPVVGGLVAPIVGLRNAFLICAAFYLAALLLVLLIYREPRTRQARVATRSAWLVFRELLQTPGFALLMLIIFGLQTVDRSFSPILPLYVQDLGVASDRVATVAGMLFSIAAVFAALGHHFAGNVLLRVTPKKLIAGASGVTAIAIAVAIAVPGLATIGVALMIAGLAIGLAMTAAYTVAGGLLPADAHVTGFGLLTTASLIGLAASPVVAGFVGASGLRIVFVLDVVLLVALVAVVAARMGDAMTIPRSTAASDASAS